LGLIKHISRANILGSAELFKVTFAPTYRCNLKCKYCKTWASPPKNEMNFENIKLILRSAVHLSWIHLAGGEIFLREDIEEILHFLVAERRIAVIILSTNGMLSDRIVRIILSSAKKNKSSRIIVTCGIDGERETHDKLRGREGGFEACFMTFTRLRRIRGIRAYLSITVSQDSYRELPHFINGLRESIPNFDFKELSFNFVHRSFFYHNLEADYGRELLNDDMYLAVENLRKIYGRGRVRIKDFMEERYFKLMPKYLKQRVSPISCSALSGSCFIDPEGDVYPCINYGEKIGNLGTCGYNFTRFWNQSFQKRTAAKDAINNNKCGGCWTACEAYPSILSNLFYRNKR